LGAARQVFPVRRKYTTGNLVVALLLLGGGALAVGYAGVSAFLDWQSYGPAAAWRALWLPLGIGVVLGFFGLLAGWGAYANWRKALAIYENGLAYCNRRGIQTWRWAQVHHLTAAVTRHYLNGFYTGTTHTYTLQQANGQKMVLNDALSNVEEAYNLVEQHTFGLRYQARAQAYNAGKTVAFGQVSLSKQGIAMRGKFFAWEAIQQVAIYQGDLRVTRKGGGWFSGARANAGAIPDLHVLLSLINQVVGVKTGGRGNR
jgi:hypothetical protein